MLAWDRGWRREARAAWCWGVALGGRAGPRRSGARQPRLAPGGLLDGHRRRRSSRCCAPPGSPRATAGWRPAACSASGASARTC
ncbi:hypothetical protein [Streptomyces thioluteus]|uniref:hypothetical protein n=1 Tax=Streptomyces thioluteus TaxID=66431 RepID=UPI0031EEEE37